ncbi:MAG: hypothetical protein HYY17_11030 [Planctomycetes bacterium]|nr:hypothetical protein [Planctomycetota bacterium]
MRGDPWWNLLWRSISVALAFWLAWAVYMVAWIEQFYDGPLSMILMPFMAAIGSALSVLLSLGAGLVLRFRPVSRLWTATPLWAGLMVAASLLLLAFGRDLGITSLGLDPESGRSVVILHPMAALGGYLFMISGVANWPIPQRNAA